MKATSEIRTPVRRHNSEHYLLLMLVSFALSVLLTRLFLELTGYPKVGGGEFHVAHLLWGGLALFLATIFMLIYANRWVYTLGAILSGVGVGLFIDEVGKFITQNNDYFYPLAMPIIYAFFLVTLIIYLRARRPISNAPRAELYRALDVFQEVLDRDLSATESAELKARLAHVAGQKDAPELARFSQTLLDFLESGVVSLAPETPGLFSRLMDRFARWEARWIGRRSLKTIVVAGNIILGGLAFLELLLVILLLFSPQDLRETATELIQENSFKTISSLNWYFVLMGLEGFVGLILLASSVMMIFGRDKRGQEIGYIGLLLSLTAVNLLGFYYDQFGQVLLTLIEAVLLFMMVRYRQRFLLQD